MTDNSTAAIVPPNSNNGNVCLDQRERDTTTPTPGLRVTTTNSPKVQPKTPSSSPGEHDKVSSFIPGDHAKATSPLSKLFPHKPRSHTKIHRSYSPTFNSFRGPNKPVPDKHKRSNASKRGRRIRQKGSKTKIKSRYELLEGYDTPESTTSVESTPQPKPNKVKANRKRTSSAASSQIYLPGVTYEIDSVTGHLTAHLRDAKDLTNGTQQKNVDDLNAVAAIENIDTQQTISTSHATTNPSRSKKSSQTRTKSASSGHLSPYNLRSSQTQSQDKVEITSISNKEEAIAKKQSLKRTYRSNNELTSVIPRKIKAIGTSRTTQ